MKIIDLDGVECITVTVSEAAAIVGASHNRIRAWVRSRALPALPGRRIIIVKSVLIAFLERQSRGQK
ncbi:MAG: Helix-turn-helix domain [Deinococcota bacterium]|jgi:hypothetical protein